MKLPHSVVLETLREDKGAKSFATMRLLLASSPHWFDRETLSFAQERHRGTKQPHS
jgi:hypothetical protein